IYLRDGRDEVIRALPCPVTALPEQLTYLHFVVLTLQNALKRLPDLYQQDFAVREVLRLPPAEERWLWEFWGPPQREHNPVFGRLDAVIDFLSPMWKDTLRFAEPNLSCVGGINLVPVCEGVLAELVVPEIRRRDPQLRLDLGADMRDLLIQKVLDHLQAIGRPARTIAFVEVLGCGAGPDGQSSLADCYHARYGLKVLHADPSELTLRGDEVCHGGEPIDLVYRDYEVRDLLELERDGVNVEPLRALFRQNRVISSVAAELDQQSCWEVLTDPQHTQKHCSAEERQLFRRHIPWTRLLADRTTSLPDGSTGGLLEFVRANHETLVLKPNRSYGGKGVVIGHLLDRPEWEAEVARARA